MDTPAARTSSNWSAWFWLAFGVGLGLNLAIEAARTGVVGYAISAVGFALLGAAQYMHPINVATPISEQFRVRAMPNKRIAALGGVGVVLIIVGTVLRWAI